MISASSVEELIMDAFPVPENLIRQIFRIQQLESVFAQLKKSYGTQRTGMMGSILTHRVTDPNFRIIHQFERHVNAPLLREKRSDIYERLVYLKASNAKQILGERHMYDLCLETDEACTMQNSLVRTEDLISLLGESESAGYLIESISPAQARLILTR